MVSPNRRARRGRRPRPRRPLFERGRRRRREIAKNFFALEASAAGPEEIFCVSAATAAAGVALRPDRGGRRPVLEHIFRREDLRTGRYLPESSSSQPEDIFLFTISRVTGRYLPGLSRWTRKISSETGDPRHRKISSRTEVLNSGRFLPVLPSTAQPEDIFHLRDVHRTEGIFR